MVVDYFEIDKCYKLTNKKYYTIFKVLNQGPLEFVIRHLDNTFPKGKKGLSVVRKLEFDKMMYKLPRAKLEEIDEV